jgi:hypothetical protein
MRIFVVMFCNTDIRAPLLQLFPNKPAARVRNSKRDHIRAKVDQGKGIAGTAQSRVKKDADKAKSAVRGEASTMSRAARLLVLVSVAPPVFFPFLFLYA